MNLGIGLRNLRRVREVVSVLVFDYGFGYVFDQLGLWRDLPVGRRRRPARGGGGGAGARAGVRGDRTPAAVVGFAGAGARGYAEGWARGDGQGASSRGATGSGGRPSASPGTR